MGTISTQLENTKVPLVSHSIPTDSGSSGAPLLTKEGKVYAIHKGTLLDKSSNFAILLKEAFENLIINRGIFKKCSEEILCAFL